eukprot:416055_1
MSIPISPTTNVCHDVYQNVSTNLYLLVVAIQSSRNQINIIIISLRFFLSLFDPMVLSYKLIANISSVNLLILLVTYIILSNIVTLTTIPTLLIGSIYSITCVTINEYQVARGNEINKEIDVSEQCILTQSDFCNLSRFKDNTFDKIFAIESTCHAPNRCDVYNQVYRVLKPGGLFASYEWVLNADKFDFKNKKHLQTKYEIEKGNALPDLITDKECIKCFKKSKFDIINVIDVDQDGRNKGQLPWHHSLMA